MHQWKCKAGTSVTQKNPLPSKKESGGLCEVLSQRGHHWTCCGTNTMGLPSCSCPKAQTSGSVRLCVDMREANKAICWLRHPMPILDWIWTKVNSSYPCILTHDISAHFLSPLVCLDTNASVFESMLLQKCFKMWLPRLLVKFPMGKKSVMMS